MQKVVAGQGGHGNPFDETYWSLVQSRDCVWVTETLELVRNKPPRAWRQCPVCKRMLKWVIKEPMGWMKKERESGNDLMNARLMVLEASQSRRNRSNGASWIPRGDRPSNNISQMPALGSQKSAHKRILPSSTSAWLLSLSKAVLQ